MTEMNKQKIICDNCNIEMEQQYIEIERESLNGVISKFKSKGFKCNKCRNVIRLKVRVD